VDSGEAICLRFSARRDPLPNIWMPDKRLNPSAAQLRGLLLGIIFVWAVAWLLLLNADSLSPPTDNVEQLTWVRSLQWGYYKHPPLPTVLLRPLTDLFGLQPWTTYVLGALMTCSAILIAWRLAARTLGEYPAWLATLGTMCVTYYNGRLNYYNHNIVLLLAVAAAALMCWRAFARRSLFAWTALGACLGLGALAKYQVALAGVSVLAFWAAQRGWRDPTHRIGLLIASVVAGLVFSPHALWLVQHDFPPVHYAMATSLGADLQGNARLSVAGIWLADQVNRISPSLMLGVALVAWGRGATSGIGVAGLSSAGKTFLWCWGFLPILTIAALGIVDGASLQLQWGTAFTVLTCAWLMALAGPDFWTAIRPRAAVVGFVAIQALLFAVNWATSPVGIVSLMKHHNRNFDSQHVAEVIAPRARQVLGGPVRIVAGPAGLASVIALRLPERPLVLIDGSYERSPWLSESDAAACGVLWVADAPPRPPLPVAHQAQDAGVWWGVQTATKGGCRLR